MNAETTEDWFDPDTVTFGDRVAGAREAAGMTQVVLAKRLGIKLVTLQKWEDDVSEPRANKLSMMSGVLNISLTWLLTGEGDGLTSPDSTVVGGDARAILDELQATKADAAKVARRIGELEVRLRRVLSELS